MGNISFPWSRLPYDAVPLILVHVDDASQCAFAATSRCNHVIVEQEPSLAFRQKALRDATFDKRGDAFVQAPGANRAALRCKRDSLMLPLDATPGLLLAVASLVAGSAQRPTVRYTPEQLSKAGAVPAQIDVLLNCAWRGLGENVSTFVWPAGAGISGIDLQSNGIGWHAGDLQLPDGVTYVNLARNAIGDSNKHLKFPESVRHADLRDNWINLEDRANLCARFPRIQFVF